jgi:virulence-associated protein VapD
MRDGSHRLKILHGIRACQIRASQIRAFQTHVSQIRAFLDCDKHQLPQPDSLV